jgi:hypothetical protein
MPFVEVNFEVNIFEAKHFTSGGSPAMKAD